MIRSMHELIAKATKTFFVPNSSLKSGSDKLQVSFFVFSQHELHILFVLREREKKKHLFFHEMEK